VFVTDHWPDWTEPPPAAAHVSSRQLSPWAITPGRNIYIKGNNSR